MEIAFISLSCVQPPLSFHPSPLPLNVNNLHHIRRTYYQNGCFYDHVVDAENPRWERECQGIMLIKL